MANLQTTVFLHSTAGGSEAHKTDACDSTNQLRVERGWAGQVANKAREGWDNGLIKYQSGDWKGSKTVLEGVRCPPLTFPD